MHRCIHQDGKKEKEIHKSTPSRRGEKESPNPRRIHQRKEKKKEQEEGNLKSMPHPSKKARYGGFFPLHTTARSSKGAELLHEDNQI
ncbi:hypothetical protein EE612_029526 [Oryza sativa]|nr:hypothetical protein EE612_029526 [Oryza sativa]